MDIRYSYPRILIQDGLITKPLHKVFMLHRSGIPTNKPPTLLIRSSSIENKVYEDHTRGIVCYKNESGEIICEGYDEGPRFHQREVRIIDNLQESWFRIVESENGAATLEMASKDTFN